MLCVMFVKGQKLFLDEFYRIVYQCSYIFYNFYMKKIKLFKVLKKKNCLEGKLEVL